MADLLFADFRGAWSVFVSGRSGWPTARKEKNHKPKKELALAIQVWFVPQLFTDDLKPVRMTNVNIFPVEPYSRRDNGDCTNRFHRQVNGRYTYTTTADSVWRTRRMRP